MIETLARALCEADGEIWEYSVDEPNKNSPLYFDSKRDMYLGFARAILKALETPTPEMIEAGGKFIAGPVEYKRPTIKLDADATAWGAWKRMIRAASVEDET